MKNWCLFAAMCIVLGVIAQCSVGCAKSPLDRYDRLAINDCIRSFHRRGVTHVGTSLERMASVQTVCHRYHLARRRYMESKQ